MAKDKKTDKLISQLLEDLIVPDNDTFDINLYNKKWTLKMLTADEHLSTFDKSSAYSDNITRLFKLQQETLKMALVACDDNILTDEEKEILFSRCPAIVVIDLYNAYDKQRAKIEKELDKKINSKAPTSESQDKEEE